MMAVLSNVRKITPRQHHSNCLLAAALVVCSFSVNYAQIDTSLRIGKFLHSPLVTVMNIHKLSLKFVSFSSFT